MKKRLYVVGTILIVLVFLFLFKFANGTEDVPFNTIELSNNNGILNALDNRYYDTIMSVGLDQAGISGVQVQIQELSDKSKDTFDGELKAHIRYFDGMYYLFIDNFKRKEAIEVIAHEIIHIIQYQSGQLSYDMSTGILDWEGQPFDSNQLEYDKRPWESDAFDKQNQLESKILEVLY
jgi:hypothetical protein